MQKANKPEDMDNHYWVLVQFNPQGQATDLLAGVADDELNVLTTDSVAVLAGEELFNRAGITNEGNIGVCQLTRYYAPQEE